VYVLPSSLYVSIVEDDAEMKPLSPKRNNLWAERETLTNDYLAGLLGIAVKRISGKDYSCYVQIGTVRLREELYATVLVNIIRSGND